MTEDQTGGEPEENASGVDSQTSSERFLYSIVENIPAMVFVKEATELRFVLFNRAGEELLGYAREAMIGKNDFDFFREQQAEFFVSKDRDVLESGEILDIPEEPIDTARGRRILHTKKIPILDDDGEPEYLLGISMDITDQKHRAEELERSRRELQAANEELEAFSYSVAHDLRAPLRSIDGFSKALEEDFEGELDDQAIAYLHRIRGSAQRMGQLIDDLLDLSRVTRTELQHESVDLSAIARATIRELRETNPDREIKVEIEDDVVGWGDPRLLAIVLQNLLENAWKFTGKKEAATITFGSRKEDGRTVYHVQDDGAGFDAEYAEKLFGTFERLHSADEFEGTGIGLATVNRIVQRHGGEVWAEGQVGAGATLHFTLGERPASL